MVNQHKKAFMQLIKVSLMKKLNMMGFYAVCTNLEDPVEDIIKVNHRRWEIEESFRIMKTDFKSRPVFHSKR